MLRTATRPRFLALLVVALAAATLFAALGDWQLARSRDEASEEARAQAEGQALAPLDEVLAPAEPVEGQDVRRLVEATGTLDADRLLVVPDRELDGEPGRWLLAPLVVEGTGGTLPVVLGWLADDEPVPAVAGGRVRVEGRLEQGEPPVGGQTPDVESVPAVSPVDLVNVWEPPVYTAYLAVTEPQPPLQPVPASRLGDGLALQNFSYALQWWLFAAFAVFFWWRLVWDAHRRELEERPAESVP
ncbi:MAG: SURF1 family protein [Actinomycetes bacterium]